MKNLIVILIFICSFIFAQEPCDGHCLSDEVVQQLRTDILTLENDKESNEKMIENLNSQIYMYIQIDSLNVSLVKDLKQQLIWKEEMIDLVKPKWYDNKYLWFFGGMIITSGAVYLAGQID